MILFERVIRNSLLIVPAAAILLLALLPTSSIAQISNPQGELRPADEELIWVQTMEGRHYNEFWNYHFYFDNGIKIHLVYNLANFGGLKSPVSGLRGSIYYPDGTIYQVAREFPIERLLQDMDNHRMHLSPTSNLYFEGQLPYEHKVVVKTTKDGVTYDIEIELNNIEPAYMWGDGLFTIQNEQIGIVTHIPYAEASGHISINGNKERVTGTAYMDHTFQNQTTTRLMNSGYRFVNHIDRNNWDIIYTLRPSNNSEGMMIGYRLRKYRGEVELYGIEKILDRNEGRALGTRLSNNLRLKLDDGSTITISRTEDQEKYSLFRELGWLARNAAKTFLGGEVIDIRGTGTLETESERIIRGEYNFFVID